MILIIIQYNARNDVLKTAELVVKSVVIIIFAQQDSTLQAVINSDTVLGVNIEAVRVLEHHFFFSIYEV